MEIKKYIGKIISIGLTLLDQQKNIIEQYQTQGVIKKIGDKGMMKIERSKLPVFTIPFDEGSISEAEEGIYTERSTGIEIKIQDYLSSWTIRQEDPKSLGSNKLYGFETPEE
jgi:hypothetical protein